jgi:capsular exopolysaccharide synthesis family protein
MSVRNDQPVKAGPARYPEIVANLPGGLVSREEDETHILAYWRVLVTRRWTVAAIFATVALLTLIWSFKQTPMYAATMTIEIERENPSALNLKDVYQPDSDSSIDYTLQSYYKILTSRSLARRVVSEMRDDLQKEFAVERPGFLTVYTNRLKNIFKLSPSAPAHDGDETDELRPLVDQYLQRLTVNPLHQSWLVEITFQAKDPKLATRVINAHGRSFIEQNIENRFQTTQQVSDFLSQQIVSLKSNLEQDEQRLQKYGQDNQIMFTEDGQNTVTEKLKQLQQEYTRAQAERFQKESIKSLVQTGSVDSLPQSTGSTLILQLVSRLMELRRQDAELAVTFAPEYPNRKRIRSQIDEVQKEIEAERTRVVKTIEAEYSASVERERLLSVALEQQRDAVNKMNREIIQYNILKRDAESSKDIYNGLLTRLKEAGISGGLRASNIRIVDKAEPPKSPVTPRHSLNLALGSFFGLIFGIGLALFQDHLDSSIKSPDDITRYLGLAALGTVPKLQSLSSLRGYGSYKYGYGFRLKRPKSADPAVLPGENSELASIELAPHDSPESVVAESYRSVRTSLFLSSNNEPARCVVVTSAVAGEGKTATAVNTAIIVAQTGARVVLVDADMRRPRVHKIFKRPDTMGLSGVLAGTCALDQAVSKTSISNLSVLPCGAVPPNPGELILSARFKETLESLKKDYDLVVLDSPPLSNVSDGRILASVSDAAILVVKAFSTSRYIVGRAVQNLAEAQVRIAGVVLNDLDLRYRTAYSPRYRKGYVYDHYYGHIAHEDHS